jgi:hypothetical protein
MTRFKLRARTSLLATLNLGNYSELGLIVVVPLNSKDNIIYNAYRSYWRRFQRQERLPDDALLHTLDATITIFGMGRVGSGAKSPSQPGCD